MSDQNMDYEAAYKHMVRLNESYKQIITKLEAKVKELMAEIELRDKKLINCQSALDINKEIMRNALTSNNQMKDDYAKEIQELRDKIKKFGG